MAAWLPALIAAASAEGGGGGGLADINFGLTLWTIVLFILFAAVLTKFGWGPLLKAVEDREKGIRDAVDGAQKANSDAQVLLGQHREALQQARRERDEMIKQAMADAQHMRTELMAQAKSESDQLVQRAKEQIEREKKSAIEQIRGQVADIAVAAAAKIVTSSLTPDAQKRLATEFIEKLPQS